MQQDKLEGDIFRDGHATMMEEIAEDLGHVTPDLVVASVGGGGLMSGVVRGQFCREGHNQRTVITHVQRAPF